MKRLVILLLVAWPAVAGADLRGAPPDSVVCTTDASGARAPDVAKIARCTGECSNAATRICARVPGPIGVMGATIPVAGTSWQGAIATGLGQFLADRAKAEVATWFEDLVRKKICELKSDAKPWLPHTCKLMQDDMGTGQQLASGLLVEAIRADLPSVVDGLMSYVTGKLGDERLSWLVGALPALFHVGQELVNGRSPLDILKDAANDASVQKACRDRPDKTRVTGPCLIVFAGITIDYYGAAIAGGAPRTLAGITDLAVKLLASGDYRTAVCTAFDAALPDCTAVPPALRVLIDATVVTTPEKIKQVAQVVEDAFEIDQYLRGVTGPTPPEESVRFQLAHTLDLIDKLWGDTATLVWDAKPPPGVATFRDALAAGSSLARGDYRKLVTDLVELAHDSGVPLPEWTARLMPLIVDLSEAKDANDVTAALSRAAAPIGGWKLKRQKFLVSVTGLVGVMGGYERAFHAHLDAQPLDRDSLAGGLVAPVGLELSWPVKHASSLGVLFSVLDLGQVTWSRLEERSPSSMEAGVRSLPDPSLAKVFSPGAYLVLGIGNSPFTVGVGASIAPDLRIYTGPDQTDRALTVWRLGFFFAVDVTVFPL